MNKEQELIKFWTYFGFEKDKLKYVDGEIHYKEELSRWLWLGISLDTLYKYAIPKLQNKGYSIELLAYEYKSFGVFINDEIHEVIFPEVRNDNPVEALSNAILMVIDKENNGKH